MKTLHRASLLAVALASCLATAGHAAERSWSYTYNDLGLIETANGPRTDVNDITTYSYDSQGRLTQVSNALGHTTQLSNFDNYGNPQTLVDANGVTTILTYAPQGWLTSTSVSGASTRFEHDAIGQITKVTRGDGSWLAYTWSAARRLTQISNNLGEVVDYSYDAMGNRTSQRIKDASGTLAQQQTWAYDELGRLLRAVGAEGQTHRYGYDLNDNPTLSRTPKQHDTNSAYDALNRLVSSTDPLEGVTGMTYDAQDNLTQVVDPRGVTTRYEYDGLGNLTKLISPDSGTTTYTHDAAGNVISKTDARGVKTTYTYDALNRLTGRQYPASPALNVQYHYDITAEGNYGIGRLTAIQDASGITGYVYDARGNLIEQVRSVDVAGNDVYDNLTYAYDTANQLVRIDYPGGISVAYSRNSAGQVTGVTTAQNPQPPSPFASDISYLPFGPLKSLSWANGLTLLRSHDQDYRLTQQSVGPWQASYGYDANSNIESLQGGIFGDLLYGYDELDRLTQEEQATRRQAYAYDAVGNRVSKTVTPLTNGQAQNSTSTTLSYATNSNRLTLIDGQAVSSDAAGNLTKDRATRELEYDPQGRLAKVKVNGSQVAEYRYNALGQRTHKLTSDGVTTFLYGPDGQLLGETRYGSTGVKLSSQYYLWLDSLPIGGLALTYNASGAVASSTRFYLHADHLNTPRLATNQAGEEIWRWASDAFGEGDAVSAPNSGLQAINLRFAGQYYDGESGLHYNYFRDYDPETGRYVESDPIGLGGGINTYAYVASNPLGLTDPKGLSPTAAAGAGAGLAVGGPPGALVGGLIGLGVGAWGANAAWNAYQNEAGEDGSPSASASPGSAAEKARERKEYSRICKTPIPPTGDQCEDAKANLQRLQQCLALRENFSRKWFNDNDVGHVIEINNTRQAIENLKDFLRRVCGEQCS
ncbi:sugar-binding protein [Pseudomonas sp. PA1(2017)]|uniref:RHS repeat-associated core domain-containing protein n=1 Tax=Pseudomonas sp. PA1(2017) TaxID=1932113 RepID=UPI00095E3E0A|nr:RHS repeat-associated core domain-containing protein [Pseudomonas sp. PA1(2017)]OLU17147.1 sugar-binding protein [Pseudomonas sp. PA1(2017)]